MKVPQQASRGDKVDCGVSEERLERVEKGVLCSTLHKHEGHTSFHAMPRAVQHLLWALSVKKKNLGVKLQAHSLWWSVKLFSQPGTTETDQIKQVGWCQKHTRDPAVSTPEDCKHHLQTTDTCLFKYQRPAQRLWKTENNIFLTLNLDMRVKQSEMPRVWAELWSHWSVSQFEFDGIYSAACVFVLQDLYVWLQTT